MKYDWQKQSYTETENIHSYKIPTFSCKFECCDSNSQMFQCFTSTSRNIVDNMDKMWLTETEIYTVIRFWVLVASWIPTSSKKVNIEQHKWQNQGYMHNTVIRFRVLVASLNANFHVSTQRGAVPRCWIHKLSQFESHRAEKSWSGLPSNAFNS